MREKIAAIRALSRERRYALLMLGLLALTVVLYKFAAAPLLAAAAANNRLLLSEGGQLERYRSFASRAGKEESAAKLEEDLQRAEAMLPPQLDLNARMRRYYGLAAGSGVQITACKAGMPKETEGIKALSHIPLEISFQGDYFAVLSFLRQLENGPDYVSFAGLRLTGDEDAGTVHAAGVLNLYFLPPSNG